MKVVGERRSRQLFRGALILQKRIVMHLYTFGGFFHLQTKEEKKNMGYKKK